MDAAILGAVTVACLVSVLEFAEAFTIVLAVGIGRDWKSALIGAAAAVVALALTTAMVGTALVSWLPQSLLRLIVGTLLLIFGLQWLRKAVRRLSGVAAHPDEEGGPGEKSRRGRFNLDWFAVVVAFKGVFLEGIEVVFIVVTVGASAGSVPAAATGAAFAALLVVLVAVPARRVLGRLPEHAIGFAVGVLLTAFGTFWAVEGLGMFAPSGAVHWPGGDWALCGLLGGWAGCAFTMVGRLRRRAAAAAVRAR